MAPAWSPDRRISTFDSSIATLVNLGAPTLFKGLGAPGVLPLVSARDVRLVREGQVRSLLLSIDARTCLLSDAGAPTAAGTGRQSSVLRCASPAGPCSSPDSVSVAMQCDDRHNKEKALLKRDFLFGAAQGAAFCPACRA